MAAAAGEHCTQAGLAALVRCTLLHTACALGPVFPAPRPGPHPCPPSNAPSPTGADPGVGVSPDLRLPGAAGDAADAARHRGRQPPAAAPADAARAVACARCGARRQRAGHRGQLHVRGGKRSRSRGRGRKEHGGGPCPRDDVNAAAVQLPGRPAGDAAHHYGTPRHVWQHSDGPGRNHAAGLCGGGHQLGLGAPHHAV